MDKVNELNKDVVLDAEASGADVVKEKLADAWAVPGYEAEFDPEEAELAGAFVEDAISEAEALNSSPDLLINHE